MRARTLPVAARCRWMKTSSRRGSATSAQLRCRQRATARERCFERGAVGAAHVQRRAERRHLLDAGRAGAAAAAAAVELVAGDVQVVEARTAR